MKPLFKGIYSHFTAQTYSSSGSSTYHPVYTDIGGRFYNTEGPQSVTEPYIVYNLVSNMNVETFNEETEEALIQFNIYSNAYALTNVTATYRNLTDRFDGATFASFASMSSSYSYAHTYCKREFSQLIRSDDTWQYIIQYRMRITK